MKSKKERRGKFAGTIFAEVPSVARSMHIRMKRRIALSPAGVAGLTSRRRSKQVRFETQLAPSETRGASLMRRTE